MYLVLAIINLKFRYVIHYTIDLRTHCGLVKQFGDIDAGQHWLRLWLAAWGHKAITWAKHDLLSRGFCGFHLKRISQDVLKVSICKMSLNSTQKYTFYYHIPQRPMN